VKYQALMAPDGLICGLYGPKQGRRHNSLMLNLSGLVNQVTELQARHEINYMMYGDPAYHCNNTIMIGFNRIEEEGFYHGLV